MEAIYPATDTSCYHCGDTCTNIVEQDNHSFCCQGCSQVYLLLQQNNLCSYYEFDKQPGIKAKGKFTGNRFAYLDDETVVNRLALFKSKGKVNIVFSLPQMHCTSCIYLLENLYRIDNGIIHSRVNFEKKEIFISYDPSKISLRKAVEILAFIGYEPVISLDSVSAAPKKTFDRKRILQLGVAGFCFSNIMMLSFPEYFSGGQIEVNHLQAVFTWIIFSLSIPVLFYSASPIFISAWKSGRQGIINIDAPIAFASLMTFGRSYYEIITGTGPGYLDSGTGIIFFMLIGRWFQAKSYDAISFDRQYKAYFPLGVTVLRMHKEENIPVTKLKPGDTIIIRNEEMIPADAILEDGDAKIDYSFVSGENDPVTKLEGELIYAGGIQKGVALKLSVIKMPSQSYITELWNNDSFASKKHTVNSFIHPWSRYFTLVLFSIAILTAIYWSIADVDKLWPAVTAVLIVACPCSLLLSATFTFGHMQRIFGRNKLYLKNAGVIESMAAVKQVVFDKTGTLTKSGSSTVQYYGTNLSSAEKGMVKLVGMQSAHPLGKALVAYLATEGIVGGSISQYLEIAGKGMSAIVDDCLVQLGNAEFIEEVWDSSNSKTIVHVKLNHRYKGYFEIKNEYRPGIHNMVRALKLRGYQLHVLSGDNDGERSGLREIFGKEASLHFNFSPVQKLDYIKKLQSQHDKILMIGDGLNDAGALMKADCGIAVSDDTARFSPACDAIIDGDAVSKLDSFLGFAKRNNRIVAAGFILSILYNIAGISFAMQAKLSPLVAAILMPASSISIVALAWLLTYLISRRYSLSDQHDNDHVLS